jgi:Tfp pilus assembly protein PilO
MTQKIDSKILLIILLFLVSVLVTVFIFVNIKQTFDTREAIAAEALTASGYRAELAELGSIRAQEDNINAILTQYDAKIPAAPGEDEIIEFFYAVTIDGELQGITFSERVTGDVAVEMPLKVTVRSDYYTMLGILSAVADAPRLYTVSNIDINSTEGGILTYTINLSAYYA